MIERVPPLVAVLSVADTTLTRNVDGMITVVGVMRSLRRIVLAAVACVIGLTGCGNTEPTTFTSTTALASAIGCQDTLKPLQASTKYESAGRCLIDHDPDSVLYLYIFDNEAHRDAFAYEKLASGGIVKGQWYAIVTPPGAAEGIGKQLHATSAGD